MRFEVQAAILPFDGSQEALEFYSETLGLEATGEASEAGSGVVLVPDGGAGIVLRTDDVDAAFEALLAAGAEVVAEPAGGPPGRRRCAFLDPSGNLVRIEEAPPSAGGAVAPRPRARRRLDTERRLREDVDVWVASASDAGVPYLVPLSFDWEDGRLLVATPATTPTGRNLHAGGVVRLALGHARDVVMIDAEVEAFGLDALPLERVERFVGRSEFDPRTSPGDYRWFRIAPTRIQAWREVDEIAGRTLMRDGRWLD